MKKCNFDYLNKYIIERPSATDDYTNIFYNIQKEEIEECECRMGFPFPDELRQFYWQIGAGILDTDKFGTIENNNSNTNRILRPYHLASIIEGVYVDEEIDLYFSKDFSSLLEHGDLPFFEMYDSSQYLILKSLSENSNAVWYHKIKIEDSFERFIWRLYNEDINFHNKIIESYI
jgi:hypothetical protein